MALMRPGYKFSIRGDFLGVSGDDEFETNTLKVAAELKHQVRRREWNHRVKMEAINRYGTSEDGVEIIVLPSVERYRNLHVDDVKGILHRHLGEGRSESVNASTPKPVR